MTTAKSPTKLPQSMNALAIDFVNQSIKVALITSLADWDQDVTQYWGTGAGSLQASEHSQGSTGYTTGGETLGGPKTITQDNATNKTRFKGTLPAWTAGAGQTISAVAAVVYRDTGTPATSPVLSVIDFEGTESATDGGTFTINVDGTDGVFTIAAS